MAAGCARTTPARDARTPAEAAPPSNARRERIMPRWRIRKSPCERGFYPDGGPDMAPKPPDTRAAPAQPWRPSLTLAAEKDAAHVGVGGERGRVAAGAVAAVHQDVAAPRDGEGLQRVLLHHHDRHAVGVDRADRVEQALGGHRRQPGR